MNYPTDSKYFTIDNNGKISVKPGIQLSGKVVLPNVINGITVTGVKGMDGYVTAGEDGVGIYNQTKITHIFLEDPATSQLSSIGVCGISFADWQQSELVYMELPVAGNVTIGFRAFQYAGKFMKDIDEDDVKDFFSRIGSIGDFAFFNVRNGFNTGVYILDNIATIGGSAFNNNQNGLRKIEIGSSDTPFNGTNRFDIGSYGKVFNNSYNINSVTIYTTDAHSDWEDAMVDKLGISNSIVPDFPI